MGNGKEKKPITIHKQGRSMRIAIGKETVEINEDIIRGVQMVVFRGLDLEQYIHNYSARMWIDAILSHFAKMMNEEPSKKVEIDVDSAKSLREITHVLCSPFLYDEPSKAIEKAEKAEKAEREENLPPGIEIITVGSPKHVTQLDGRIDQLEKRVDSLVDHIGKILDRQDRFLSKLE